MIGSRSRSRQIALQVLFSHDVRPERPNLDSTTLDDAEATPEVKAFAGELVAGVLTRLDELDQAIATAMENWDVKRLATVDRNILRLAVYEMVGRDDVPTKVAINEAIEMGKRFSTAQSGGFINGILDRVRKDLGLPADEEPDEAAATASSERNRTA